MNLKEKFEKWSIKASKGSTQYAVCAYAPRGNKLFHVLGHEKLALNQMYVGVFDKGKMVNSFGVSQKMGW